MRNCRLIALIILTANFAGSQTILEKSIYPTETTSVIGRDAVAIDLLKSYENELKQIKRKMSKKLTVEKQNIEISLALDLRNKIELDKIKKYVPENPGQKVQAVSDIQAQSVLNAILSHPIVSDAGARKFDKGNQYIGYCFGRATFVHLELLRRGVDPRSIGKLFAIGPLYFKGRIWDFHVATVVRKTGGGWLAIDGIDNENLEIESWTKKIVQWSTNRNHPTVRFYFSDAVKFHPTAGAYNLEKLHSPHYNGYFIELEKWLSGQPQLKEDMFK